MYLLRKTLPSDLKKISKVHKACFQGSFSVKLGNAYTIKSFGWFLAGDNRFLHHVEDESGIIAGYCGGFISKQPGDGSTSGMMQFAMKQAAFGILKKPWLLFDKQLQPFYPLIIKNILKKLGLRKSITNPSPTLTEFEKKTGLVVIGVHPDYRGKGVFEMLMNNFEAESLLRKINKLSLSVKDTNERAIAAYKKAGWLAISNENGALLMRKMLPANDGG